MKSQILIFIAMVGLLAQIVVSESQQSYSIDQNEPRELRSSGGGRGGGGRSSSSRSSYSSYRSYSSGSYRSYYGGYYNPYSGSVVTVGYYRSSIGFYYGTYNYYYTYAYYGAGASQTTCFPQDAECLADVAKRTKDTWIFIGIFVGFFGIFFTVLFVCCCCQQDCCRTQRHYETNVVSQIEVKTGEIYNDNSVQPIGVTTIGQFGTVNDGQNLQNQQFVYQQQWPCDNPTLTQQQAWQCTQYQHLGNAQYPVPYQEIGGFGKTDQSQPNTQQPVINPEIGGFAAGQVSQGLPYVQQNNMSGLQQQSYNMQPGAQV